MKILQVPDPNEKDTIIEVDQAAGQCDRGRFAGSILQCGLSEVLQVGLGRNVEKTNSARSREMHA
jgi:hypothetical protein